MRRQYKSQRLHALNKTEIESGESDAEMMAAKRVFSVIVFMILSKLKEVQSDEVWQKEQFPNPARDIEACGRRGKVSWICDPDNILSYETANKVEELLFSVRKNTVSGCSTSSENPGFQIGVAVMKKMRGVPDESIAVTAENFAKHLHDRWGVGNAECDDGAVLLLSITDRQIYVSTGRGAKEKLTDDQIDVLIEEIKSYLKKQKYDQSVELAVVRMGEVFSGKVLKQPFDYGLIIFSVIFFGIAAFGLYIAFKSEDERYDCTTKLERIQEERDRAKHSQKSYASKSCPICLEEFQPEIKTRLLACGHKYCEPCLVKWLEDHVTCPICRKAADGRGGDDGACHSSSTFDFTPELQFRLMMLQLQHPFFINSSMVDRWSSSSYTGSFLSDPAFFRSSMPGGGSFGSGSGFGGGGSSGGGGRGGSW